VAGSKFAYGLCYAMPVDHTMQRLKLRLLSTDDPCLDPAQTDHPRCRGSSVWSLRGTRRAGRSSGSGRADRIPHADHLIPHSVWL
jgi:hypothetical protein